MIPYIKNPLNIENAQKIGSFIYKQIPNKKELILYSMAQTCIDIFFGMWVDLFGDHPSSRSIFRDIAKIIPGAEGSYNGDQIGNGSYTKDDVTFLSMVVKPAIKIPIIFLPDLLYPKNKEKLYKLIKDIKKHENLSTHDMQEEIIELLKDGPYSISKLSRAANFAGEIASISIIAASKDRQDSNSDIIGIKYLYHNFNYGWVMEGFQSALPKVLLIDILGSGIKGLGIKNTNFIYTSDIVNIGLLDFIYGANTTYPDDFMIDLNESSCIHEKIDHIKSSIKGGVAIDITTYGFEFISKFTLNIFMMYVLGTSAKAVTGGIHIAQKHMSEMVKIGLSTFSVGGASWYFYDKLIYDKNQDTENGKKQKNITECLFDKYIDSEDNYNIDEATKCFFSYGQENSHLNQIEHETTITINE
ncbi:MAG: hypothetical protein ACI8ZF_000408 [Candidatus Midichloriaceae bacterium]|jgi:hypothetical protein